MVDGMTDEDSEPVSQGHGEDIKVQKGSVGIKSISITHFRSGIKRIPRLNQPDGCCISNFCLEL